MPDAKPKSSKDRRSLWGFFASVRLTIVLLIILAVLSILGTLIPQQREAIQFAEGLSPSIRQVFLFFDLFDMYHSHWFRILLGLLALNLIICSLDRFPATWKRFTARPEPDRKRPFDALPPEQTLPTAESPESSVGRIRRILHSRYGKTREKEASGDFFFYAEQGGFSHFGVYLVHLSVLLILVGGLVGSFWGFEAYVNIPEGGQIQTVMLRNQMRPLDLDFEVRCDRFIVDFYENKAPKEYRSDLGFLVDGKEILKAKLLVNHPIEFMGVTFYQSSYGVIPGKTAYIRLSGPGTGPISVPMEVELEKAVALPGGEGTFRVMDIRSDVMHSGPAVLVSVEPADGKEKVELWVFKDETQALSRLPEPMRRSSKFNPSAFKPYTFYLDGLETRYYTGLQVNRDPGVPFVWGGCVLMIAGLFFTFFTSHRRIWVRVLRAGAGSTISVAGMSSKNPVGLNREIERLMNDIQKKDH